MVWFGNIFTLALWDADDSPQCKTMIPQAILVLALFFFLQLTSSCRKAPGLHRLNCAKIQAVT